MPIFFRVLLYLYPLVAHIAILAEQVHWALLYLIVVIYLNSFKSLFAFGVIVHVASLGLFTAIALYLVSVRSDHWLIFLPPVLIPSWLAYLFIRSLYSSTAFITRLAQIIEEDSLDERQVRYTRVVTAVWGGVFLVMVCEAVLLALYAPFHVWSWWVHIGNYLIIMALFVIEFLFRYLLLGRPVYLKKMLKASFRTDEK